MSHSAFVCYSHVNRKELEELKTHLKYAEQQKQLKIWNDQRIAAGAKWREEIAQALTTATVRVLLVSAEFLASDFITQVELPVLLQAAQEKKLRLLCILLSPCLVEETPLAEFQLLNTIPLSLLPKGKRQRAWANIAKAITSMLAEKEVNTQQKEHSLGG
jgi:hypothetical protein